MSYQEPKTKDFGVNLCDGCLEKQRIIDRQNEEIKQLKQKQRLNERKLETGYFGSSTPSSQIPVKVTALAENQARQGGARPGHPGVGRQVFGPAEADEVRIAEVESEECPTCRCQLVMHTADERAIYDLQREEVRRIFYRIKRKRCPRCQKTVSGRVSNAMARAKLSNDLIVEIAEQHYVPGRSLGQLAERFGLSEGTLCESLRRTGRRLEPCLEKLTADYRQAPVRQADETAWRTDGGNGYSWYFGSAKVSLYLFRQTRSGRVVREVLGTQPLEGVLVVDRYAGYNQAPCRLQYCYAHLLREMKDLEMEFERQPEVAGYTREMKICLTDAMQLRKRNLEEEEYHRQAAAIKQKILELSERPANHQAVRRWQDFYVEKADRLYQWCESAEIPAENNYAEREIRKVVIARKVSYGSQSEEGAKTREIWTSVLQSLKKREAQPRDKLREVLNELSQNENLDVAEELFGSRE